MTALHWLQNSVVCATITVIHSVISGYKILDNLNHILFHFKNVAIQTTTAYLVVPLVRISLTLLQCRNIVNRFRPTESIFMVLYCFMSASTTNHMPENINKTVNNISASVYIPSQHMDDNFIISHAHNETVNPNYIGKILTHNIRKGYI